MVKTSRISENDGMRVRARTCVCRWNAMGNPQPSPYVRNGKDMGKVQRLYGSGSRVMV